MARAPRKRLLGDARLAVRWLKWARHKLLQLSIRRPRTSDIANDWVIRDYHPEPGVDVRIQRRISGDTITIRAAQPGYITMGSDPATDKATVWSAVSLETDFFLRRISGAQDASNYFNGEGAGAINFMYLDFDPVLTHLAKVKMIRFGTELEEIIDFGYDHRTPYSSLYTAELFPWFSWREPAYCGQGRWAAPVMHGDTSPVGEALPEVIPAANYLESALAIYEPGVGVTYRAFPATLGVDPRLRYTSQPMYLGNDTIVIIVIEVERTPVNDEPKFFMRCLRSINMGATWVSDTRLTDWEARMNSASPSVPNGASVLPAAHNWISMSGNDLVLFAPTDAWNGSSRVYDGYYRWYSPDGGITWSAGLQVLNTARSVSQYGTAFHIGPRLFRIAPSACGFIFYDVSGPTYYFARTIDGGVNWTVGFAYPQANDIVDPIWDPGLRKPHLTETHIGAADDAKLVLCAWDGTEDKLYESLDGAQTWTEKKPLAQVLPTLGEREIAYFLQIIPASLDSPHDLTWPEKTL